MSLSQILDLMGRLICFATFLQSLEILKLKSAFSEKGIWKWETLKDLFPMPQVFGWILKEPGFSFLIWARLIASALTFFTQPGFGFLFLFLTTLLIAWRWRGAFNGGSDSMTALVLLSLTLFRFFPNSMIQDASLWYLALQLILSYFIAGIEKLKRPGWRNGLYLKKLFASRWYGVPGWASSLSSHSFLCFTISWAMLIFECLSPLAILNSTTVIGFMILGISFHLANFIFFGLNRFFWSWVAAYPVLLYCYFHIFQ